MGFPRQLDLFMQLPPPEPPASASARRTAALNPVTLDDDALLEALPQARRDDCQALADELVRRRPPGGIAALDSLSRRFCGFGLNGVVAEQATALRALAQIGGRDAARTIARIIADGVVADPGLPTALQAAADLHSDLPQDIALRLLRHANPAVRAPAALLAPARPDITAILLDLLHDLNAGVADAAALSLARTGRTEARPRLLHLLHTAPAADIIEAIAEIADETCIVALNRAARARPEWRPHIIDALETIGSDLALRVAASLE